MTEKKDTKRNDDDMVLDWDDAVDSWGQEQSPSASFQVDSSEPRGSDQPTPVPEPNPTYPPTHYHSHAPALGAAGQESTLKLADTPRAKGMYRPPSAAEVESMRARGERNAAPTPSASPSPGSADDDVDPDDVDDTRIAEIPRELIESLARLETTEGALNVGNISVVPDLGIDEFAISLECEWPPATRSDTDPNALDTEGSGMFSPSRPSKPSLEPDPYRFRAEIVDHDSDEDGSGVLDLSEVVFDDGQAAQASGAQAVRAASVPPPPPNPLDTRAGASVLSNLDELSPPRSQVPAPPVPSSVLPPPAADRGAAEALRTVRARRPRVDHLPLVGSDQHARRGRAAMLESLAAKRTGLGASPLLTQAAALYEEVGDTARAARLYEDALQAEPAMTEARRAQARLSLASGDMARHTELLQQQQATPALGARDRAQILQALALCRWLALGDQAGASLAASEAVQLLPDDVACATLLARLELATKPGHADTSALALAHKLDDDRLIAVLQVAAGRAQLERGEAETARRSFELATQRDPAAADAQLGLVRSLLALGRMTDAAERLAEVSRTLGGASGTALRRQAARLLACDDTKLEQAARWLLGAEDGISLRTASLFAARAGASELRAEVVAAWTGVSHGHDRALSLITLAELRSAGGRTAECEEALQAATRAAPQLALVHVVREALARRRGDTAKLAELSADGGDAGLGPVSAAAKLAHDPKTREQELSWLERAGQVGAEPVCIDTLLIDASAELGNTDLLRSALGRTIERSAVNERLGPTLVLADLEARRRDDQPAATRLLAEAAELDPRSCLLARAVARHTSDPEARSALWCREAEATLGNRAAFAYLRSGNANSEDSSKRLKAYAAAHEASPTYAPAAWLLHQEARKQNALVLLANLHGREAGRSKDPLETVAHLVRGALIRETEDADGAAAQLSRALDLAPTDPVLRELVLRLGDAVPATLRAEAMQRTAEHAPVSLRRAALLAAAGAFEDARQPERAADLYSTVLDAHPEDPIAEMGYGRVAPLAGKGEGLLTRRRTAAEAATTPAARVQALEELMALEGGADPTLAAERARAILAIEPRHALSLRQLERLAMEQNDVASLVEVESRMLALSKGPSDKTARLRLIAFAHAQAASDPTSSELDAALLGPGLDAAGNPWLARQLMGAAVVAHDPDGIERASHLLFETCSEPIEVATAAIGRARDQRHQPPAEILQQLEEALVKYPEHPIAAEALAEARLRAGDLRGAAERFEAAGRSAHAALRVARLWYRAGRLWQDDLRSPDRARDAFRAAAESDLTYADVQARLESLLSGRNDLAGLIALTETRLDRGGTPDQIAEAHRSLAKLYDRKGDREAARTSLRKALSVAPEHLASLRDFAQLREKDQEWRESAEALIRLARLSRDPGELREVFFRLGEVYDLHLPDARRAEAAYRRVLKLGPKHAKALERLAALYQREGKVESAIEALERLAQASETPARRREVTFELANLKEANADPRGAEETLESLRRSAPSDLHVLRHLAAFYRRQNASSALAMHLNRAANDLRAAIADEFDDAALWSALVEVVEQRGRRDAASVCASAAFALGVADAGVVAHTDNEGGVVGVGGAAFSELLDDLLYPENMNPALRVVFRHAADALNKAAPFDVRMLGGEKLDKKHWLRGTTQEIARWMSVADVEIYVTEQLPLAFVPIQDAPVALLVGKTLLDSLTRNEAQFLVARAFKMARAQLSLCCRVRPEEVGIMLHALIRAHYPEYAPAGLDLAMIDEWGRRIVKHLSRKARDDIMPHLAELSAAEDFDPTRAYEMASAAASRAGLLATGSVPSATTALCKLAGIPGGARHNAMSLAQVPETRELVLFSISEAHFEARQRAGVDRR